MNVLVWRTSSEEETFLLGQALAGGLAPPVWIGLTGPLGAGKTRFAQGLAKGLGYAGRVRSPTFVLENRYAARVPIVHQDLYRLDSAGEEVLAAWDENEDAVILVEWPERAEEWPDRAVRVGITPLGEDMREIRVSWTGAHLQPDEETRRRAEASDSGEATP